MNAGILIVGSLLWDTAQERDEWRKSRLGSLRIPVRVPIRYGRKSRSRGGTYTMTIRRSDDLLGQAVVAPCVRSFDRAGQLQAEAARLWRAEGGKPAKDMSVTTDWPLSAPWGCVGALFRPGFAHDPWITAWKEGFVKRCKDATPPVSNDGLLGIPWPQPVDGGPIELDVLLATATKAEDELPSAEEVADAWIGQGDQQERYFFNNVVNGIRTPEDAAIWRRMCSRERDLRWSHNWRENYSDAIRVLESE